MIRVSREPDPDAGVDRSTSLAPPRLPAMLVTLFAAVALIITAAGIAGVVSFSVNQRTTEVGVLAAVAALSCLAPARRAAANDPMRALCAD